MARIFFLFGMLVVGPLEKKSLRTVCLVTGLAEHCIDIEGLPILFENFHTQKKTRCRVHDVHVIYPLISYSEAV